VFLISEQILERAELEKQARANMERIGDAIK